MRDGLRPITIVLITTFAGYHFLLWLGAFGIGIGLLASDSSMGRAARMVVSWPVGLMLLLAIAVLARVVWKRATIADWIVGPQDDEESPTTRNRLLAVGLSLMGAWMVFSQLPVVAILGAGHVGFDGGGGLGRIPSAFSRIGTGPSVMLVVGGLLLGLHRIIANLLVRESG
jgi:hypothetical protein